MAENKLKEIDGKRIRRQYFTIPVLLHYAIMIFVPYYILIFTIQLDKFNMQEWIASIWTSIWICFWFSLPWIILKILNRLCFGKIVCVFTDDGIYHRNGFIEWDRVSKVEYIIDLPQRYKHDPERKCRAVIYTENETIVLLHAPLDILRSAKKYNSQMKTKLSKGSKWFIAVSVIMIILVPLIPFLA